MNGSLSVFVSLPLSLSRSLDLCDGDAARMKTVSHPRCVQLRAILDEAASNGKLYVVLEYMRGGPSMEWDESECCFQARAGQITEQVAQRFMRNTLSPA